MSDLKHRSEEELRREVGYLSRKRAQVLHEAHELEGQAERLLSTATAKRQRHHNLGQREAWARIYLARAQADDLMMDHNINAPL